MVGPRSTPTRGEGVYVRLRGDIMAGRLRPGSRLPFAELCARYDTSVGVLREGLSRLVEQGLVVAAPQQGYRVTALSATDLTHLTEARTAIESLVLRESVAHGDIAWESQALAAHHTLARTPTVDPADPQSVTEDWAEAHAAFHAALLAACPNPRLLAIAEALRDSAELYRRWTLPLGHDDHRDVAGEHAALLDACLARDPDRAADLLADHLGRTTRVLLEAVEEDADPATSR